MLFLDFWYHFMLQTKYKLTFSSWFWLASYMLEIGTFQRNNLRKAPRSVISMCGC